MDINKKTSISLGLFMTILVPIVLTSVAWGVLIMRVQSLEVSMDNLNSQFISLDGKFDEILRTNYITLK